jgi:hypothetical protein
MYDAFYAEDKKIYDQAFQGYGQWKVGASLTGDATSFAP